MQDSAERDHEEQAPIVREDVRTRRAAVMRVDDQVHALREHMLELVSAGHLVQLST